MSEENKMGENEVQTYRWYITGMTREKLGEFVEKKDFDALQEKYDTQVAWVKQLEGYSEASTRVLNLKDQRIKELEDYEKHILEYAHNEVSGEYVGFHIAEALVKEHQDFKYQLKSKDQTLEKQADKIVEQSDLIRDQKTEIARLRECLNLFVISKENKQRLHEVNADTLRSILLHISAVCEQTLNPEVKDV